MKLMALNASWDKLPNKDLPNKQPIDDLQLNKTMHNPHMDTKVSPKQREVKRSGQTLTKESTR